MDRAVYVTLKQRDQRQLIEDKRKAVNQVPMLAVLSQVGSLLPRCAKPTNQYMYLGMIAPGSYLAQAGEPILILLRHR